TDSFVSNAYNRLSAMPCGSTIGTSSARRTAILKHYYPHLEIKLLRGNVQTRLNKLDNGEYDGIILASAGLKRLNLQSRIKEALDSNKFIPAIGQGALAIEILSSRLDLMVLLASLDDNDTFIATEAEREVGRLLGADCSVPIGVYAKILHNGELHLSAVVANNNDGKFITASVSDNKENYLSIAKSTVKILKDKGVENILGKKITSKLNFCNGISGIE
ncbi:MAG: hydroxymethylbilane synthase, partial [Burkholderiales bacterium]|nr:hydroxymethylbilane synthase [Burkholderiales bacterium]